MCSPVSASCISIALASRSTVSWRDACSSSIARSRASASSFAERLRLLLLGDVRRDAGDAGDLALVVDEGELDGEKGALPISDPQRLLCFVALAMLEDPAIALRDLPLRLNGHDVHVAKADQLADR